MLAGLAAKTGSRKQPRAFWAFWALLALSLPQRSFPYRPFATPFGLRIQSTGMRRLLASQLLRSRIARPAGRRATYGYALGRHLSSGTRRRAEEFPSGPSVASFDEAQGLTIHDDGTDLYAGAGPVSAASVADGTEDGLSASYANGAPSPSASEQRILLQDEQMEGVTIVKTVEHAKEVLEVLMAHPEAYHACDTEVADIDLSAVGPVGHGKVICVSIYSGPTVDFGDGPGTALWVENMGASEGVLQVFKDWFEDERYKKVWHNYGFDRHVLYNEGIDAKGFGGDTMHMARLWDSGRDKGGGGYSLEALTDELLGRRKTPMKEIFGVPKLRKDGTPGSLVEIPDVRTLQTEPQHRRDWIRYSAYDAEGTWFLRERLEENLRAMEWQPMGRSAPESLFDFYKSYYVPFGELLTDMERNGIRVEADTYLKDVGEQARVDREQALQQFREWAGTITPSARFINPASSAQLQTFFFGGAMRKQKRGGAPEILPSERTFDVDMDDELEAFLEEQKAAQNEAGLPLGSGAGEGASIVGEAPVEDHYSNLKVAQLKELLELRGLKRTGKKDVLIERLRQADRMPDAAEGEAQGDGPAPAAGDSTDLESLKVASLKSMCKARGLKHAGLKKAELIAKLREDESYQAGLSDAEAEAEAVAFSNADYAAKLAAMVRNTEEESRSKKRKQEITIRSLGLPVTKYTASGWPAVSADVLRTLAGDPYADPPEYGAAFQYFEANKICDGREACRAIYALHSMSSIDTMLSNFIEPLRTLSDARSRVHCSLNINTETGRLSARKPNLQNQPALEKDQYRIRSAFTAEEGKRLIVADYGQLELRLMAHITDCKSMIEAFSSGGCFHSRTAVGMFPHVRDAVDRGDVLLEWDESKGKSPAPLLKDVYGSERRKAKTLNFSIAYGKTVHGLSKDWGVTVDEAKGILDAWYEDRPEVKAWQKKVIQAAHRTGYTRTLMGRYRKLPFINEPKRRGHGERAAINTPLQRGAADIVVLAMINLKRSEKLKRLGYQLLLQVHDEVILEGPEESVEEALQEVRRCMESPWDDYGLEKLKVALTVDAKHAKSWFDAK